MRWQDIVGDEIFWYFASIVWFIFVGINVNTTLGLIYYGFPTTAILLALFDKDKTIKFDRDGRWGKSILTAGIVYAAFVIINSFLISFYSKINIGGIISLLGATTPALAQSKILNFLTFAFPVAFVETMAVIRYFDYLGTKLNINIRNLSLSTFILMGLFSFGFMILHTTAKGITNNSALILVFVMMFVSLIMAVWYQEGKQAVLFHVISNLIASTAILGFIVIKIIIPIIIH